MLGQDVSVAIRQRHQGRIFGQAYAHEISVSGVQGEHDRGPALPLFINHGWGFLDKLMLNQDPAHLG
jgi:hypothetical protein